MDLRNYLLIVFLSIHSRFLEEVYVTGNTNESDPLQNFIKQGEEAVLQCLYESDQLGWDARKNVNIGRTTIAVGKDTVNGTKYKVSPKPSTVLYYRLHVLNVQPGDELIYRCVAGVNKEHFIQLNLYVPPSSLYFNGSMNNMLEGREGTDLLIRCIAVGGKPPPDVSILDSLLGSRPSKTQEVSYRIPLINRDYHQKSIVCQATSAALDNPRKTTVHIYLNLKSLTPIFNKNQVSTEETAPLTVSCTSYGSRPAATLTWTIGGNDVTSSSTTSPPVRESNDTNTVTSTLTYSVNRTHNKQNIICIASNSIGSVSVSKTLDVKYAPDITVTSPIYTQSDVNRIVTCNPSGNPNRYTYHKWQHKSKYGEIIREFEGNNTLKLPDAEMLIRYQDSGEYVCTASNGIKGRDNRIEQTGSGYVTVNAEPVFTSDTNERLKQFGEINKDVELYVNVYSIPKFTSFEWTRDGNPLTTHNSVKYKTSSSPTIVRDTIHGKEVQLEGYNLTLTIHNLRKEDFFIYTVTIKNGFGNKIYPIILESSSAPETPGNFSSTKSSDTFVTVQWDPNVDWGHKQTFYLQYRVQGLLEWTTILIGEEAINELKRRRTYTLSNLQRGKAYELKMYAENTAGKRSNATDILIVFTGCSEFSISSAVIGAVIGAAITIVIVCAPVLSINLFKWRKGRNKTKKKKKCYENTGLEDIRKGDEYDEVDNTSDVEHTQSCKTYESLGKKMNKEVFNVYDDLENPQGLTPLKSQQAGKAQLKLSNNSPGNIELKATTGPIEQVYANEVI